MSSDEVWPSEWLRGVLSLAALAVLARQSAHGYAIATALADHGLGEVKGGTLYPLLGRLESAGHVTAAWEPGDGGPGRKVYALTDAGRSHLAAQSLRWAGFTRCTQALLDPEDHATSGARGGTCDSPGGTR